MATPTPGTRAPRMDPDLVAGLHTVERHLRVSGHVHQAGALGDAAGALWSVGLDLQRRRNKQAIPPASETPQDRLHLQLVHDAAVRAGALCSVTPGSSVGLSWGQEARAIQQIHDGAARRGATCTGGASFGFTDREESRTMANPTQAAQIEAFKTWLLGSAEADGVALTDEDEQIVDTLAAAAFGQCGKNRNWPTVTRVRATMDQEARMREQQRQQARDRQLQKEYDEGLARWKEAMRAHHVQRALDSTPDGRAAVRFNEERAATKRAQFSGPGPNAPKGLHDPKIRAYLAGYPVGRQILREHGIDPDEAAVARSLGASPIIAL